MSTMGLLNSPFWLTWGLFEGGLPCAASAVLPCINTSLMCTTLWLLSPELLLLADGGITIACVTFLPVLPEHGGA